MSMLESIMAEMAKEEKEIEELEVRHANLVPPERLERLRREHVFGESRIKPARLEDLRGMPKVREGVGRIIEFFRDYRELWGKGARIQPGILLEGPPGTGKTLTARIIATESGAKLVDAGSFPRSDRLWGAADIQALFSLVREYHAEKGEPVIVYFDRLESICNRKLSNGVITAFLSELDGLAGKNEGVFVIGATAEPQKVHPEVLRAGRLGHHIRYFLPDSEGRLDVLRYYVERKPHDSMDLETLCKVLPGYMSPAAIEELVEGAYVRACQESRPGEVKLKEIHLIEQLVQHVIGAPEGNWRSERQRYRACVHEAGHVIVGIKLGCGPKLVVVPKEGYQRGVTLFDSEEDLTKRIIEAHISSDFGGEVAEELVLGERDFGGTRDIQRATEDSIKLVAKWGKYTNYWGFPEDVELYDNRLLNPLSQEERSRIYSEALRVRKRCYERAREVLERYGKQEIERVARLISERKFLLGNEVERAVLEATR
jgi:cell division protease FtsH